MGVQTFYAWGHKLYLELIRWPQVENIPVSGLLNCLHYCLDFMLRT